MRSGVVTRRESAKQHKKQAFDTNFLLYFATGKSVKNHDFWWCAAQKSLVDPPERIYTQREYVESIQLPQIDLQVTGFV